MPEAKKAIHHDSHSLHNHCVLTTGCQPAVHSPFGVVSFSSKACLSFMNWSMRICSCSHRKSNCALIWVWTSFNSSLNISLIVQWDVGPLSKRKALTFCYSVFGHMPLLHIVCTFNTADFVWSLSKEVPPKASIASFKASMKSVYIVCKAS